MRFQTELIALKDDSAQSELVEILLAVTGEWKGHQSGAFRIDSGDLEKMKLNFDARNIDTVIDYEHQSLYGSEAPAAGWIKSMHIKDNKLYGMVAWTPRAKEYIKNGEYRYLSPVFNFGAVDKKSGAWIGCELESVALTNTPFLDELDEVRANKNLNPKGEKVDNPTKQTDAQVIQAAKEAELQDEIAALKASLETAKNEAAELKEQLAASEVESAIVANKLPQSQKQWALSYAKADLNGFKEFLRGANVTNANVQNDMFANKSASIDMIDVVKFALDR